MPVIKWEIVKFFRQKQIYIGIGSVIIFGFLGFLFHRGDPSVSSYALPTTALRNSVGTLFILFPTSFCGFAFTQETRWGTDKILRSRSISWVKILGAKIGTALVYSFLVYGALLLSQLVLGFLFFEPLPFSGTVSGTAAEPAQGVIYPGAGFSTLSAAYLFQAAANVFFVSLITLFTLLFRSAVYGFGGTLFTLVLMILTGNIESLEPLLPLTYFPVYEKILLPHPDFSAGVRGLAILGGYSLILIGTAAWIYARREVRE